jgi:hypothetical protein
MQAFAALAVGLLIVASIFVGLRLVALHRRTGGAPELMLGLMLLLSVGVGYAVSITTSRMAATELTRPLHMISSLAVNAGFSLLFLFAARVFRPEAAWAKALAGAGVLILIANAVWRCWTVQAGTPRAGNSAAQSVIQMVPIMAAYVWTACESLRYYGLMRRRVRLGIGDAAVCDRFLLCGGMAICATSGILLNTVAVVMGVDVYNDAAVLIASSTTGLGQAALLVLAFAPPRSYLAWVETRARAMAV